MSGESPSVQVPKCSKGPDEKCKKKRTDSFEASSPHGRVLVPHFDCSVDLCIPVKKKDDMGSDNNSKEELEEASMAQPIHLADELKDKVVRYTTTATPESKVRQIYYC